MEVPNLTGTGWRTSYRHEDGDPIGVFHNPALAARGIAALMIHDGRMRLIVGCALQQPEQDAIDEGFGRRARLETHLLAADLTPPDEEANCGLKRNPECIRFPDAPRPFRRWVQ